MRSLRLFATLTATFALAAGATGAYAQTTLTMSSWVGPTQLDIVKVVCAKAPDAPPASARLAANVAKRRSDLI
jgi:hypothetical protein